jgi:CRP-like cAMP-binding protein
VSRSALDPQLKDVAPFDRCSARELRVVAPLVTTMDIDAGAVLMRQGERGDALVIVVDGTATVRRDDHEVAEVGRGDVVGELALLVDAPRSATVVATTPMTIARLAPESLPVVLDECPTIAHAVLTTAIRRLAHAA